MPIQEVDFPAIFDAHVHLRQDDLPDKSKSLLSRVAHYSGRYCDQLIAMPNTKPALHDRAHIIFMREQYEKAIYYPTTIHMTAKWLPMTTPADVRAAKSVGVIGFKLYPQGVTTNSDDGMPFAYLERMAQQVCDVLGELEKLDLVLLCHGEAPGFVLDRELNFLPWFRTIAIAYPKLRMTLEHISTESGIKIINELAGSRGKVLGTITLHHMMRTLDDVIGAKLNPDEFCMPIPKRPGDRDALLRSALGAATNHCFALGSDSAPHDQHTKYCRGGCAGVFTAPVLLESLFELFTGDFLNLEYFCIKNACNFYGFQHSGRRIILRQEDWIVPATTGQIVPFRCGETIRWRLIDG